MNKFNLIQLDIAQYDAIAISISGGKDSQTLLGQVCTFARQRHYSGKLIAIHADTGAEWAESLPHCKLLCDYYKIELHVANPFRPLPLHIRRRCEILQQAGKKGGWPSWACRYCQSDCKRSPVQKTIRHELSEYKNILSVTGERREESRDRAKLEEIEINKMLCTKSRTVFNWRPILDYNVGEIWQYIKSTGLPRHIAYDKGNERLSCAICVLANDKDIRNGAIARPDLAETYLNIENETGHTFKNGQTLKSILEGEA